MPDRQISEQDALRVALGPTPACPPLEELESLASGEQPAAAVLSGHVQSCPHCQTELHLLQTFLTGEAGRSSQDAKAVSKVAERLRSRSGEIFRRSFPAPERLPWWQAAFTVRRLTQVSLAAAAIFLIAAAVLFFRSSTNRPQLQAANHPGPEVLRSGAFAVLSPAGDLQTGPKEVRWERVPQAARYQVALLEVDRSQMWKAETAEDRIELPANIQAQIVPAKTLFAEVLAFDSSGNKVGDTGLVRFRLVRGDGGH